jgi:hypothetical protein
VSIEGQNWTGGEFLVPSIHHRRRVIGSEIINSSNITHSVFYPYSHHLSHDSRPAVQFNP